MKHTRLTLLALVFVLPILMIVGLLTAVSPQPAHAAPIAPVMFSEPVVDQAPTIGDDGDPNFAHPPGGLPLFSMQSPVLFNAAPYSLTTLFASNNQNLGNMFDVIAGSQPICIINFDINTRAGTTTGYELYYREGSYVGYENNSIAWIAKGGVDILPETIIDVPTPLNLGQIWIPAGEQYGIYITSNDSTPGSSRVRYTNSDGTNLFTNDVLTVTDGVGNAYPFGTITANRTWNGTVYYSHDPLDCLENNVSITNTNGQTAVTPGLPTTYTVVVANNHISATNATVASVFNEAPTSASWVCAANDGSCTLTGAGTLNDSVFLNVNGRLTYTLIITTPATLAHSLIHTATVTPSFVEAEQNIADNTAVDTDTLTPARCHLQPSIAYTYDNGQITGTVNSATDLYCLHIERMVAPHPNATDNMTDGYYWYITGTTAVGTPATDFSVSLTFPHTGGTNPAVCRYPGNMGGYGWDCSGVQSVIGATVVRTGVTAFSDWAIGYNVGPTAVTLQSLTATSQQGGLAALIATLVAALSGAWLWVRRRAIA